MPKNKTPRQPWIWAEERSPWFPCCSPTPGIASNIRTRPLCRCTLPGRSNYLDKGACHFWIPSTSPYTCKSIQSRGLCSSSTKNAEDNGNNFARCNLGHQLSPRWMLCRTSPCRGRAYSRTMGSATGSVPLRVTHTGAIESITGTSVTITRNWLKKRRARRRLLWSHHEPRQSPYYSGTRELSSAQCRWREPLFHPLPPVATLLLALASTVYVKEVTLTS